MQAQDSSQNETAMQRCIIREHWKNKKGSKTIGKSVRKGHYSAQGKKVIIEKNKLVITSKES